MQKYVRDPYNPKYVWVLKKTGDKVWWLRCYFPKTYIEMYKTSNYI